jgi:cell shape-determining protein MreC
MRNNRPRTFVLIGTFILLFFFGQLIFSPKAYLNSRLGQAFQAPVIFFRSLSTRTTLMKSLSALSLENQSLLAQLHQERLESAVIKENNVRYLRAPLYSSYPFNMSNQMLIAGGSDIGIVEKATVLAMPDIFIGQIASVEVNKATVRTIFDPNWELPVKIGDSRVDALLVGGPEPKLTLVSKRKPLLGGETVYLASRDFPYGLTLGTVAELRQSKESLFLEGRLIPPYAVSDLSDLYIQL